MNNFKKFIAKIFGLCQPPTDLTRQVPVSKEQESYPDEYDSHDRTWDRDPADFMMWDPDLDDLIPPFDDSEAYENYPEELIPPPDEEDWEI